MLPAAASTTLPTKPYHVVPIADCDEPLVALPEDIARVDPHPYLAVGAVYPTGRSPFQLREGVIQRLLAAQQELQNLQPGWCLQVFDGYRPVAVQRHMVKHTFNQLLAQQDLTLETLAPERAAALGEQVYSIWAPPNENPETPPPHSTGGAVDLTLVDESGIEIDMGSPIDELSGRSHPDYFRDRPEGQHFHHHREILNRVMSAAGFERHPGEWWHFSFGDQMWAWQIWQRAGEATLAQYGRVD